MRTNATNTNHYVRHSPNSCTFLRSRHPEGRHNNPGMKGAQRDLSLTAAARQFAAPQLKSPVSGVVSSKLRNDILEVKFGDGTEGRLPFVWLRDNCQCPQCFSVEALGRKLLLDDLDIEIQPTEVQESIDGLIVKWSDGHKSEYPTKWLQSRSFMPASRAIHRERYALRKEPWGAEHTMRDFDYNTMMSDDRVLLDWLLTMERKGSAMVRNAPKKDVAGPELIEHIAYVKQSHYGPHSPVINRPNTNNVAFTNAKLGMHNDLPQYEHMPGLTTATTPNEILGSESAFPVRHLPVTFLALVAVTRLWASDTLLHS
ncbi:Gamma-butyrobetaine dioxygenase [Portunus trituberculatus]|uniref:Gamma-butyrobetaine dioxygenase n=1 Tax=Portunus trituberculatus TaxID=210409 RepID=A0A5B7E7U8_PORTR|nr:Gamma-butyrobetaine dioxygenase [Portunus trituberculatus]